MGGALFVNKCEDVQPKRGPRVVHSTRATEMYTLDQLTNTRPSSPATAEGASLPNTVYKDGAFVTATTGTPPVPGPLPADTLTFKISVDGAPFSNTSTPAVLPVISCTLKPTDKDPPVLARQLEIVIHNAMG